MSVLRRHSLVTLLVVFALLPAIGVRTVRAALPAAPRQPAPALSPEEAVIAIKPLQLQASDIPEGYGRGSADVDTPASEAIATSGQGADANAALQAGEAEGTQACSVQQLMPPAGAPVTAATLHICLMADQPSAQNVVQNEARAINPGNGSLSRVTLPAELVLGDGAPSEWQLAGTDNAGKASTSYDVRWSRGIVAYELQATAAPGQSDAGGATSLSQRIDAGEGQRAAVTLPQATVPAPVSEAQRVNDLVEARSAFRPAAQPPAPNSSVFFSTTVLPATSVLNADDPRTELTQLDVTFQRAGYGYLIFRTPDGSHSWGEQVTVDASPTGAAADLRDLGSDGFFHELDAAGRQLPNGSDSTSELTHPVQFGDTTRAFKTVVSYPNFRNGLITYTLRWTHGPVVLLARIAGNITKPEQLSDLVPWAQQVEQDYQSSALPAMARTPAPASPQPAPRRSAPAAPSDLAATAQDATTVQLSWTIPAGADGIVIEDATGQTVVTTSSGQTSYTVQGLSPGSYACFTASAFNGAGSSAWSDWACAQLPPDTGGAANPPSP